MFHCIAPLSRHLKLKTCVIHYLRHFFYLLVSDWIRVSSAANLNLQSRIKNYMLCICCHMQRRNRFQLSILRHYRCCTQKVPPRRMLHRVFFRSLFKFRSNTCCCRRRRRHWLFGWSKFMGKIDNLSFEFESRVVARLKVNKLNSGKKNFNSFFLVCGAFKRIECYNGGGIDIRRHV